MAASGGQGGIGGLRVSPTPSLDSLLTPLYRRRSAGGWRRRSAAFLRGALPLLQGVRVLLCVLPLPCGLCGASLRRLWLWRSLVAASGGQGGIGGLRVPPTPSLDSRVPLCTAAAPLGDGGGGAARSYAALCRRGKGCACCFAFCSCLAVCVARSCAAVAGGSHRVAASGGQGGIGGLRVPPTPSLDSLLTPLYRRRSAGGGRRRGAAFWSGALPQGQGCGVLLCVLPQGQGVVRCFSFLR